MTKVRYRAVCAGQFAILLGCAVSAAASADQRVGDYAPPSTLSQQIEGQGSTEGSGTSADPHAAHRHLTANNPIKRSIVKYSVPAVKLLRDDGIEVTLDKEINDGRPVVVNFIYTTCTTICPLSSQEFSNLQDRLGADRDKVHLVSISIDPEQDTPAHLSQYARHFQAGKEWQHYTGTVQASIEAQRAFNVYRGDKMSHTPVTLLRGSSGDSWVRLDGFATGDELYSEVQGLRGAH
jgi:protein SCO1/2